MNIFDCDRHVMEPVSMWEKYVDPQIFKQSPVHIKLDVISNDDSQSTQQSHIYLPPTYCIGDTPILKHWNTDIQIETALRPQNKQARQLAASGLGQLSSMNNDGISKALIFPTFAGYIINHESISNEVSTAYAQGYNKWILDYCAPDPQRLVPVALVSRHYRSNFYEQLSLIAKQGFTCITIRPEPINNKHLGDSIYESFWDACNKLNLKVLFHGGTHLHGSTIGSDRFTSRFALHACSHALEAQMAFVSLLEGGVFNKYPDVKFVFLEAGASWLPYWLWRLDNICYPEFPNLVKDHITVKPSEYFKRHCYISIEPGEPGLDDVVNLIGSDKLLFGTDFPHPDHQDFSISSLLNIKGLTSSTVKDILEINPAMLF
ncbi:amidohydrolase family protein [Pseudoalteromonas sp. MMG012]|uniref:amidohydrolase family protein n=1 Tax=Pseudoalteromonas sp. MMG012 TaxID=2822686 RepID=UPI001B3A735E|nr:amidohydrolase family protein [Pseudoalteromonas sp. MMG012]MBQ4850218.1 amidohydrolase [Pseudoalteromonas sp. MMG012]